MSGFLCGIQLYTCTSYCNASSQKSMNRLELICRHSSFSANVLFSLSTTPFNCGVSGGIISRIISYFAIVSLKTLLLYINDSTIYSEELSFGIRVADVTSYDLEVLSELKCRTLFICHPLK